MSPRRRQLLALLSLLVLTACSSPARSEEPAPGKLPAGASCTVGSECASGACEGPGCGTPDGRCVEVEERICGEAITEWCGCDGKTFTTSSTCANARYRHPDPCEPAPQPAPREPGSTPAPVPPTPPR